jgi:RND superfamily putative drug exporter
MERLTAVGRVVCGRKTKWLVLAFWLVLVVAVGPLAGQLTEVQENDSTQWLPADSEAVRVIERQREILPAELAPAVIVYERPSGITPADQATAAADADRLAQLSGLAGDVTGPFPSEDGEALQIVVPIALGDDGWAGGADNPVVGVTDQVREVVGTGTGGLSVHVAGPAGLIAGSAEAFEGLDSTLLFATVLVVLLILLLVYRSPVLWLVPVFCAGFALMVSQAAIYLLAEGAGLTINAQSAGIVTILVFGVGTDYALLLIARYREELRQHPDRHDAMRAALSRSASAMLAGAATTAFAMLCLLFATMSSTRGLGPVVAIAVVFPLLVMGTLLPAVLVILGRWVFWPVKPKLGSPDPAHTGRWAGLGQRIARRPRLVWVGTAVVLGAMALGLVQLDSGALSTEEQFVDRPDFITGQEVLGEHFPAGAGQPVVVVGDATAAAELAAALAGTSGIAAVSQPLVSGDLVYLEGTMRDQPDSPAAEQTVRQVRDAVHAVPGADGIVGGMTATNLDMSEANRQDVLRIVPLVLLVVLLILALLLRAVVAPLVLVATVVLSFAAALGISTLVFQQVFGFATVDTTIPLFVFVFLVALGIDYNIFLMTRIRQEAQRHSMARATVTGLAATGGVITSAGLVLAATFLVFASLPLVAFVQLGFAVALGILLDTFVVRSVLVPALNLDLGRRMWWPGRLSARPDPPEPEQPAEGQPAADPLAAPR